MKIGSKKSDSTYENTKKRLIFLFSFYPQNVVYKSPFPPKKVSWCIYKNKQG